MQNNWDQDNEDKEWGEGGVTGRETKILKETEGQPDINRKLTDRETERQRQKEDMDVSKHK